MLICKRASASSIVRCSMVIQLPLIFPGYSLKLSCLSSSLAPTSQPAQIQDGSFACIGGQAVRQPGNIWRQEAKNPLSQV